jgi:hypothetical protein
MERLLETLGILFVGAGLFIVWSTIVAGIVFVILFPFGLALKLLEVIFG